MRKFPDTTLSGLRDSYALCLRQFEEIGGDAFEYHPRVSEGDFRRFLAPLDLGAPFPVSVRYAAGPTSEENVTDAMREAYRQLRERLMADPGRHVMKP